jgi:hypothetical protein
MRIFIILSIGLLGFCEVHAQTTVNSERSSKKEGKAETTTRPASDPVSETEASPQADRDKLDLGPTTPSGFHVGHPTSDERDVIWSYMKLPTFEDHSQEALARESELPVRMPVIPIFQISEELPGYVDIYRSISFTMMDALIEEVPPQYNSAESMMRVYADSKQDYASKDPRRTFVSREEMTIQDPDAIVHHMVFTYSVNDEDWMRHEYSVGRWEDLGFHYVTVVCLYPMRFRDRAMPEVTYYFENLEMNLYRPKS